ncbi:outer membrane protein assembly factor BamA [Marinobacterium lutimaris]|uniref:Outer membrane protein assembly factor BamA n=1 Tax=Marinobacterium lutimaris TaxID=568106 RepID=A0A1H6BIQ8_9GAMM|nr:outer membrane protein assembly factor BamA [Marinobacterium lutimaris]SEG60610.1 Beta-barrel assembly machine subunit BamA [Marinobacterium lutimaris]
MKRKLGLLLISFLWIVQAKAAEFPFTVNDIRLEGLQRVEPGVVFRYFPVNVGDQLSQRQLSEATRELFASGYFDDVDILRDGDDVVLQLHERPSLALIRIDGNDFISEEDLRSGLKQSGVQEGDVFRRSAVDQIRLDLLRLYVSQGRYGADIQTEVEPLAGNRVALNVNITEGREATIQHINIVGNTVFDDEELKELFSLKLPNFWTFYTKSDRYSREKMSGDLERLRSYYMDRGYINFDIESAQVSITPDKRHVYITVNVTEGQQYSVSSVDVAGDLVVPREELESLYLLHPGDTFSRKAMTDTQEKLVRRLGDEGFMFANVSPVPELAEDGTLSVRYFVEPGKRTYVRRINIRGNTLTADEVLRREMEQMESGIATTDAIERSKERLERTGYFKSVNVETVPVPGTDDQVDLEYAVEEQQSGQFSASVGFSDSDGIIFQLGVQQDNFLGTGRKFGVNLSNSDTLTEYSFNYTNPYYTMNGVSRGFEAYYRERDYDEDDVSSYTTNEFGGGMNFGYPIDDYQRLSFGLGLDVTEINTYEDTADIIKDFIDEEGEDYFSYQMTFGWSDNRLNKGLFPTDGYSQRANIEIALPGSDLTYYRANYNVTWYNPIDDNEIWVSGLKGRIGYGDSWGDNRYPFYRNFYAGGLRSVRGYKNNSLGPREGCTTINGVTDCSDQDAFGGNLILTGSAELVFPMPFVGDKSAWRSLLFLDAGNVYSTDCQPGQQNCSNDLDLGDLRYSAGFGLSWLTPVGPLSIAIAMPLNEGEDDETESFQFALGQTF